MPTKKFTAKRKSFTLETDDSNNFVSLKSGRSRSEVSTEKLKSLKILKGGLFTDYEPETGSIFLIERNPKCSMWVPCADGWYECSWEC